MKYYITRYLRMINKFIKKYDWIKIGGILAIIGADVLIIWGDFFYIFYMHKRW